MRRAIILLALVLPSTILSSKSPSTIKAPTVFSFKGAKLGDSLATWRESPVPTESYPGVQPACLGDPASPTNDRRTDGQKTAGVIQCGYTNRNDTYRYWKGGQIGGFEYTAANYYFLSEKLYLIEVVAVKSAESEIVRLLSAKYGAPDTSKATTMNGVGTTIPVTAYQWRSKSSQILLTSPDLRLDRLSLVIRDDVAESTISAIDQSKIPDSGRI